MNLPNEEDDYTDVDILRLVEKYKNWSKVRLSNSNKLEHLIVYEWRVRKEIHDFDLKYGVEKDGN